MGTNDEHPTASDMEQASGSEKDSGDTSPESDGAVPNEQPTDEPTELEDIESDVDALESSEDSEKPEPDKSKKSDKTEKSETNEQSDTSEKPGKSKKRGRKALIISVILTLLVFTAGTVVWKFKLYKPYWDSYNSGSISFKVKEGDKFAVEGATVTVQGVTYTTDTTGKVTIPKLVAGSYKVVVTKDGYQTSEKDFSVVRGENDLVFVSIDRVPDKLFSVSGMVQDYVSGLPLSDVQVTFDGTTRRTDAAGGYSYEKIAVGDYKLTLSKSGYAEQEVSVSVKDASVTVDAVSLVPRGQLLFVSDRDGGKRGLYVTNYDGSDQKAFVARVGTGEDYGHSISPDGKWVVFSSTRDGVKSSYGSTLARLYIVGRDGTGLKKISDDYSASQLLWSSNSRFVYFQAYSDTQGSQSVYKFYDTQKGSVLELGDSGSENLHFSNDGNSVVYTISQYGGSESPIYTNFVKTFNASTGDRKTLVTKTGMPFSAAAFSSDDKAVEYEQTVDSTRKRYQVTLSDLSEKEMALPSENTKSYFPSPDGALKVFLETRDGKRDLYLVNKDGKNEKRLTKLGVLNVYVPVVWDETGHYVTFAVTRDGENALYIVSIDGGDPKKVTDFSDGSGYPGYYN